jgi:hypothetical protein
MMKIFKLGAAFAIINSISLFITEPNWLYVSGLFVVNGCMTIVLLRALTLITQHDIDRFIGCNTGVGIILEKVFVR